MADQLVCPGRINFPLNLVIITRELPVHFTRVVLLVLFFRARVSYAL